MNANIRALWILQISEIDPKRGCSQITKIENISCLTCEFGMSDQERKNWGAGLGPHEKARPTLLLLGAQSAPSADAWTGVQLQKQTRVALRE